MTAPLCVTKPSQHAEAAVFVIWRVDDKFVDVERQPALSRRELPEATRPSCRASATWCTRARDCGLAAALGAAPARGYAAFTGWTRALSGASLGERPETLSTQP